MWDIFVSFLIYCGIKVWWKPYGMPVTSVVARPSSVNVFASRTNRNIGLFFFVETTIESITPSSSSSTFSGLPTKTGSDGNISSSYQYFVSLIHWLINTKWLTGRKPIEFRYLCLAVDFDKSIRENFTEPSTIKISVFQAVECIVISWKLKSKESDLKWNY